MAHIITFTHKIEKYPPIVAVINYLVNNNHQVIVLGDCDNQNLLTEWREKGVVFQRVINSNVNANFAVKLFRFLLYKLKVTKIVKTYFNKANVTLWLFGNDNFFILHHLIPQIKAISYMFEVPLFKVSAKYRLLSPTINYKKSLQSSWRNISCELNRSLITQSYFGLAEMPDVIPNKTFNNIDFIPEANEFVKSILEPLKGKKIILYQGIFNFPERRLSELCEAINFLPEEYVVLLMGDGDGLQYLKSKFASDRVLFLGFIKYPDYLHITKASYIGFLSYFAKAGSLNTALNTLYCAPNKIYEYSAFGLPFISNNLPALQVFANEHFSGIVLDKLTPENIAKAILSINAAYTTYQEGALKLFYSTDIDAKLNNILLE
ncbi:glycosyltransferase [Rheinheimera metallidurans]|uniref:glycosyltransferase n=1 Tax=Rheinheimera metallidurans TaxID=2925781 RepID=UPI00300358C6